MENGMKDPLHEEALSSEAVFEGRLLKVFRDRVSLPDGKEGLREYVKHPGAVVVIPVLPDGRLVFERQFRYPVGRAFLELPAARSIRVRTSCAARSASCRRRPAMSPRTGATWG
jgi:hypothetical protein